MKIGQLAKCIGVSVRTLRFYEREGLLSAPARAASGYRDYTDKDADRLRVIRACQRIGFTLSDIRDVLQPHEIIAAEATPPIQRYEARDRVLASAKLRLAKLDQQLSTLAGKRSEMMALVESLSREAPTVCPASRRPLRTPA